MISGFSNNKKIKKYYKKYFKEKIARFAFNAKKIKVIRCV